MDIAEYFWNAPYWLKWLVMNKRKCLSNHRSRMLSLTLKNGREAANKLQEIIVALTQRARGDLSYSTKRKLESEDE